MKSIFIGAVESSYEALEELLINGVSIDGIFTLHDDKVSNVSDYKSLEPLAAKYNVPLYKFHNVNHEETVEVIKNIVPDVIFVIGLSQIVREEILSIPKLGVIGAHPGILPKYRGRAVIPWAIINDEKEIGMTLFYIDKGADTGDIIAQKIISITDEDNARTLYDKLVKSLRILIRENYENILKNNVKIISQGGKRASYCLKRVKNDGLIQWDATSREIFNLIRAVTKPYPGAFTYYKGTKIVMWDCKIIKDYPFDIIGFPGQIIEIKKGIGTFINTVDGVILIKNISVDDIEMNSDDYFTIVGNRLGINYEEEIEKLKQEINKLKSPLKE